MSLKKKLPPLFIVAAALLIAAGCEDCPGRQAACGYAYDPTYDPRSTIDALLAGGGPAFGDALAVEDTTEPRYVILMISDGWSYNHLAATAAYTGDEPAYTSWLQYPMSTWDYDARRLNGGVGYDPQRAWSEFGYVAGAFTDSASAATAMFTGRKVDSGNINTSPADVLRLETFSELAALRGLAVGAVTSVQLSHATPACWYAHNAYRKNGYAILDMGVWGVPGLSGEGAGYQGLRGPSRITPAVLIGAGHPDWNSDYVSARQRDLLAEDAAANPGWAFVERVEGGPDAGERLLDAAMDPATERLFGLFGNEEGCFDWTTADLDGRNPENPTLEESTRAALAVLGRDPEGFALMVEGGAVDWAGHANNLDYMIGEQRDFDAAVAAVIDWVEDPQTPADWENTLLIVTGDHDCGYLTAGPNVFADQPLGEISERTLAEEKTYSTGLRASWDDVDGDGVIDEGETVHWAWNSRQHTNQLIPLYARGHRCEAFHGMIVAEDPVRGDYIDNTSIYLVMCTALND